MSLQELPNNYGYITGDAQFLKQKLDYVNKEITNYKDYPYEYLTLTHCKHCDITCLQFCPVVLHVGYYVDCWHCGHKLAEIRVLLLQYRQERPPNLNDLTDTHLPYGFNDLSGNEELLEYNLSFVISSLVGGYIRYKDYQYCILGSCSKCQELHVYTYDADHPKLGDYLECDECEKHSVQIKTIIGKSETPKKIKESRRIRRNCDSCGNVYQCTTHGGIPAFMICLFCRRKNK